MKAKKTSFQLAAVRELIYYDEHPSADRQIQDTHDLGRTTVRSEIRHAAFGRRCVSVAVAGPTEGPQGAP